MQESGGAGDDGAAFRGVEALVGSRPAVTRFEVRKGWRLAPAQRGARRAAAASEQVEMDPAMQWRDLRAGRRRRLVQAPVAGFPVIDAAAVELRQDVDHRPSGRRDEERPEGQLARDELAPLPDFAGRMDDQVAAVGGVDEDEVRRGERDAAARAAQESAAQGLSFAGAPSRASPGSGSPGRRIQADG